MPDTSYSNTYRLSSGGLIFWLMVRLRIADDNRYQIGRRILFFAGIAWLPLLLLTAIEGTLAGYNVDLTFINDLQPHVRYLVSLPLLILADYFIDTLITTIVQNLKTSDILEEKDKRGFEKALDELTGKKNSFWADVVIIALAALLIWTYADSINDVSMAKNISSWISIRSGDEYHFTMSGLWFLLVSTMLLQIMLYRWIWRFLLWVLFLFRISRLKLVLEPSHADLAGGLGVLRNSSNAFIFLFFAFGTMLSVSIAQDIITGEHTFVEAQYIIFSYVLISVALTSLPLVFFSRKLVLARRDGRRFYGVLGHRLSKAFKEKWGNQENSTVGKTLLTSIDPSALADYNAVFDTVNSMRIIPINPKQYLLQVILLLVPFLPLVFIKLSITDIFQRLIGSLI